MLYFGLLNMFGMWYTNSFFAGKVVGVLPFEPITMVSNMSHRNIEDTNMTLVSPFFIFMLANMASRTLLGKVLGHEGPRMPVDHQTPQWLQNMAKP
jgi:hypothetical protein